MKFSGGHCDSPSYLVADRGHLSHNRTLILALWERAVREEVVVVVPWE